MVVSINFLKMHGLGNDFVLIDHDHSFDSVMFQDLAIQVSDRRLGIGCDQFIILKRDPELEMVIYNQDGSIAKACGNAARCVTKIIYEETQKKEFNLLVSGRKLSCSLSEEGFYSVNMWAPNFNADWMLNEQDLWNLARSFGLNSREVVLVDMGNPHIVIIQDHLSEKDKAILGEKLEKHVLFPDGVNVNFANINNGEIDLQVWERGAGFTLACGSGACASFAAALKLGFVGQKSVVNFKFGRLKLENTENGIILTGPVKLVCKGTYYYERSR